jgi:hypothetical protein
MQIEFQHSDLSSPRVFASAEEVVAWAKEEAAFWSTVKTSGSNAAEAYVRKAQMLMQRVLAAATNADSEQAITTALQAIRSELPYLHSGSHGQLLASMRALGRDEKALTIALSVMLSPK